MALFKSLAKDTAIYGMSTIVPRFLNWLLTFLYMTLFKDGQYGTVTYLYSYSSICIAVLCLGMETGFFRYVNKHPEPGKIYSTALTCVGSAALAFILVCVTNLQRIIHLFESDMHVLPVYVLMFVIIIGVESFTSIPFAYLRNKKRPLRFALIKYLNVGIIVFFNVFFLLLCPKIAESDFAWTVNWFYSTLGGEGFGIGWIFVANVLGSLVILIQLLPYLPVKNWQFDFTVMKTLMSYCWPILVLGLAGILSQTFGQLVIPIIFKGTGVADGLVGIYGANCKFAVVLVLFTQAFRYAYEPFVFSQARAGESRLKAYSDAMKYFVIFGLFIFLAVSFFLPVLMSLVRNYEENHYSVGAGIIPIMMVAELCAGVFVNLSIWYKLTDRTRWGMYFSIILFFTIGGLCLWLVPAFGLAEGYYGAAWATLIGYFVVMTLSYLVGRRYYPIPYPVKRLSVYAAVTFLLYHLGMNLEFAETIWITYALRIGLLIAFGGVIYWMELKRGQIKRRQPRLA